MANLVQIRSKNAQHREDPPESAAPPAFSASSENAPRVHIETFGCQMNEADSALILGQLKQAGYVQASGPEQADLVLLNTCAVREKAEDRIYGRSSQLLKYRSQNPNLVIGITGCMAEHLREKLHTTAPHVSLIAGPDSYRNIAALADQARAGEQAIDVELDRSETYEGLVPHADDDGVSGFVTIQRGCDKFCTFCVVPFTRGRERGVAPREVLRHVRNLAERGYKEVTLLGQTVNSYRWEDADFSDLLRSVAQIEGIERVRFTSPYPVDFSDRLIQTLAEEPKLCTYLHLPAQSGSDRMLGAMKRGYTRTEFLELVRKLRTAIPDLAISTDLMVGFCGETEEDHQETLSLMNEVQFESAFMFAYSDRQITYAAKKMQDDVPHEVKQRRLREVIDLQETFTRQAHHTRVGRDEKVLLQGLSKRKDHMIGRTRRFQSVLLPLDSGEAGEFVECRITRTTGHTLSGELK